MAAEQQRPPVAPYIVYHAFRPQVAIYSSPDVDELAAANGLRNLAQLLKPWEASVERVTLRTSTFVSHVVPVFPLLIDDARDLVHTELDALFLDSLSESITKRVPEWLAPMDPIDVHNDGDQDLWKEGTVDELTPWYGFYRERLVNLRPRTEYETFGHPVACILAVSTSNPEPMNAFAELYEATSPERLFADKPWVDPNVLRYYVLVHDATIGPAEDFAPLLDDIRRAYGLHTNMLILNAEAAPKPDSAYIDASQRPLPKPADFSKHWTSLPTSPSLPYFASGPSDSQATISQRQEQTEKTLTEAGGKLGEEDVRRIKLFLREFVVQNLAPWLERTTTQLNEQLAANRKGIAGRLFSAGRRYFGSRPASPASGSATSTSAFDPIKGFYRHISQEAQTRRLADFALMIADYRLAAANYELARKDFLNDKAWRYYSSATRMAGLLNLLLRKGPTGSSTNTESDQYLDQASSVPAAGSAQLDALRAIALYYELYQEQVDWRAAATSLAKFASDMDELPSALMIEQAAMAMLRLPHPARRRFALLMIVATHRYQKTGPKSLADRCGRQALTLFTSLDRRDWIDSRNYLERMLGRLAFNDGKADIALMHFLRIVVSNSDGDSANEAQDFLDDIQLAWERLGDSADALAEASGFTLPEALFDKKRTKIRAGVLDLSAIRSDAEMWSSLEQQLLDRGFPYTPDDSATQIKRPASLLGDATLNRVTVGEEIVVELWAVNSLSVPISLSDISLTFDAEGLTSCEDGLVTLAPDASTRVPVRVTASKEGSFTLRAVQFRYNGSLKCTEPLKGHGARLHTTKAQLLEPVYAEDTTLKILVQPPQPILQVLGNVPVYELYQGETIEIGLKMKNAGSRGLKDIRVLCDTAHIAIDSEATPISVTDCVVIDNAMRLSKPSGVPIAQAGLGPGQTTDWRVTLRGDSPGFVKLRWLFTFRAASMDTAEDSDQIYTACHSQEISVAPSIAIQSSITILQSGQSVLSLEVLNDQITENVEIVDVVAISPLWRISPTEAVSLPQLEPKQGTLMELPLERTSRRLDPHKFFAPTLKQLNALLQGRDLDDRLSLDSELSLSSALHTQCQNQMAVAEDQLFSIRTASRTASLTRQFPSLDSHVLAKTFPMYLPSALDLLVFWRLPHSGRQGWQYIADLDATPAVNVVRDLLHQASNTIGGGRYEESARERTLLIQNLQTSDLAQGSCPVFIHQTATKTPPGSKQRGSECIFRVNNVGLEKVSCRLELLPSPLRQSVSQIDPVRWTGRLIYGGNLEAGESVVWKARYDRPRTIADQGSWLLTVTNGTDSWEQSGAENIVGT